MAKIKSFRADYGVSVELKSGWHKFGCSIEIECEPEDDPAEIKKKAWNTVIGEVEKKVYEVLN